MNKILRYSFVALLAMIGLSANAGKIVFAEITPALENGVQYTDPFDGGDFTVVFGGGGNTGKYYTTGSGIRLYGDGTMTIEAKSGSLTKIQITYDGANKPDAADVVDGGTYDPATGIWTGDASKVVFTRPTGSGHWRIKAIATNGDVEDVVVPTEGQTPETAITVARALEIINGLADGATTDNTYYVVGFATSLNVTTGGATFLMGDDTSEASTVKAYKLKGLGNKAIVNTEFIKSGDKVVAFGALQKYKDSNDNITPEVSGGYVYSVNGKTEDDTPNPEDAITEGKEASSPMTVDQALNYINGFSDGFTTSKQYYVQGTVSSVEEISTSNGNATFMLGNLKAFRLKGLENQNITTEDYLKANDEVIIYAKLQKYGSGEAATPELSSGYIYSLNGKTKEGGDGPGPQPLVGDGSKENPFTVGDLKNMTEEQYPAEAVWVKGVIIGSAKSGTALNDADKDVDSNIAIAESASETTFVPVALASKSEFRTKLNVKDNSGNKGKEVLLKGMITKYFSVTGVKDLVEAVFEGETITGITNITADQLKNAPAYNVAGQRVNAGYKGLIIKGGVKVIQK